VLAESTLRARIHYDEGGDDHNNGLTVGSLRRAEQLGMAEVITITLINSAVCIITHQGIGLYRVIFQSAHVPRHGSEDGLF
jgi:hypothetical protein